MNAESAAIAAAVDRVAQTAASVADQVAACRGRVLLTGVGKAGWIAQKLTATFSSTGAPAQFLHPAEAVHGDLGVVTDDCLPIAFSNSGASEEVVRIAATLRRRTGRLIAVTATGENPLATAATTVIAYGRHREAGRHALAPTTTTAVMLAIGDAIAIAASELRGFTPADFGEHHPGGSLGRKLTPVTDAMRPLQHCRLVNASDSIRTAIGRRGGALRCGAVMITTGDGRLAGLFTDSDLVRHLQDAAGLDLDRPVGDVMTANPFQIRVDACVGDAVSVLTRRHISELPVVTHAGHPVGMIDVTDLVASGAMAEPAATPRLRAFPGGGAA